MVIIIIMFFTIILILIINSMTFFMNHNGVYMDFPGFVVLYSNEDQERSFSIIINKYHRLQALQPSGQFKTIYQFRCSFYFWLSLYKYKYGYTYANRPACLNLPAYLHISFRYGFISFIFVKVSGVLHSILLLFLLLRLLPSSLLLT